MARESGRKHELVGRDREERRVRDTYGVALLLVLGSTLALVAAGSPVISPLAAVAGLLQVGALILTLRVSGFEPRSATVIGIAAVVVFLIVVVALMTAEESARTPGLIVWLVLTMTTITAIVKRLVTYTQVTLQLLMGLLVIYVLIGVTFGLAYLLSDAFMSPALEPGVVGVSGSVYFSFITLATVGYGDLTPGTDIVRAMAIAEALIGQLYLVSVVSLAVSRLGSRRVAEPGGQHGVLTVPEPEGAEVSSDTGMPQAGAVDDPR